MKNLSIRAVYSLCLGLILSQSAAANYLDDNLRKLNWNGVEVVWIEDNQYPTYDVTVYFYDGALSDNSKRYGETELMLDQITAGTLRYTQKQIANHLEFFGASYGGSVTHEFSTYSISGLVKDIVPTVKKVCHIFTNATFPKKELAKTKRRIVTSLNNIVTSHSSLANRAFRKISLNGTPYANPVSGTLKSIKRIKQKHLLARLKHFNTKVKKRIYIKGPSGIKQLENVFNKDCNWKGSDVVLNTPDVPKAAKKIVTKEKKKTIYLVPIPNSNQAQIRVGRYLSTDETQGSYELKRFSSKYLGGGFTSRLMQELRVKRGLTYSVGAYSSSQRTYGRSGISTFTKNETIGETLQVIKDVLDKEASDIGKDTFMTAKRALKGNYLFGLESSSAFLQNLLFFDHINRPYKEIYDFPMVIDKVKAVDLQKTIKEYFNWDDQVIVILGSKKLKLPLINEGYIVKTINYKKFL